MIEGQHFVEEHEAGIGNAQFVLGELRKALDLAHRIVGKDAHRARRKWRQPRQARRLVAAERIAKHGKYVAFDARGALAFGDVDLPPARHDALVWDSRR